MDGYVKLHRQIFDSTQFADPIRLKIWIWCLIKANHKNRPVKLKIGKGYQTIQVKRGQFIFGRNKASEELDIAGSTINRHMEKLVQEKSILIQPNNQYSLITILKYEDFQSFEEQDEQVTDNQRTSNGQVTDTNNNVNNVNKDKKIKEITEASSVYTKCMALYNNFILCHTDIPAKIDSKSGASLKRIIKYFESINKKLEDKDAPVKALQYIFVNYNLWDSYHKKQLTLNQVESNLINIVNSIKNGRTIATTTGKPKSEFAD